MWLSYCISVALCPKKGAKQIKAKSLNKSEVGMLLSQNHSYHDSLQENRPFAIGAPKVTLVKRLILKATSL